MQIKLCYVYAASNNDSTLFDAAYGCANLYRLTRCACSTLCYRYATPLLSRMSCEAPEKSVMAWILCAVFPPTSWTRPRHLFLFTYWSIFCCFGFFFTLFFLTFFFFKDFGNPPWFISLILTIQCRSRSRKFLPASSTSIVSLSLSSAGNDSRGKLNSPVPPP